VAPGREESRDIRQRVSRAAPLPGERVPGAAGHITPATPRAPRPPTLPCSPARLTRAHTSRRTVPPSRAAGSDQRPEKLRDGRAVRRGREKTQQQAALHHLPAQPGKRTWTARVKTKNRRNHTISCCPGQERGPCWFSTHKGSAAQQRQTSKHPLQQLHSSISVW